MTDVSVELVSGESLEHEAYAALQREAYAELLRDRGTGTDALSPAFFRWLYSPPTGPARVALVREGGELVAANAMFPVTIRWGAERIIAWQSCSTATLPRARGKGYFRQCLDALVASLGENELFFGFPNHNSIGEFRRLGWTENGVVPTWLRIPMPARVNSVDEDEPEFGSDWEQLWERLGARVRRPLVERDAPYMRWRYAAAPEVDYRQLSVTAGDGLAGVAVIRSARALGHRVAILMEIWGDSPEVERTLMRAAAAWAWSHGRLPLVAQNEGLRPGQALRTGFLRLPAPLLPKRQVLMGMGTGPLADQLMQTRWVAQTGDWDGF